MNLVCIDACDDVAALLLGHIGGCDNGAVMKLGCIIIKKTS